MAWQQIIYNISLRAYEIGIRITAMWNPKAKSWVAGRALEKQANYLNQLPKGGFWIHCASYGEFELVRPLIKLLKNQFPSEAITITFFSPSGYDAFNNSDEVDYVCYLHKDSKATAKAFLDALQPKMAVFVKYEFWLHHLEALSTRNIPILLIAGRFHSKMIFFKKHGGLHRYMLGLFDKLYVQDLNSLKILMHFGFNKCEYVPDSRYDRVYEISQSGAKDEILEQFSSQFSKVIIVGSSWSDDERVIHETWSQIKENEKLGLIIAPHELNQNHINQIQKLFPSSSLYSEGSTSSNVLILNTMGKLSMAYQYGDIAYIGGAFKTGLHNILEAAVWGLPVYFGPHHKKFPEAQMMLDSGGGISIQNSLELVQHMNSDLQDETLLHQKGNAAQEFVMSNRGGSKKIISYILEKGFIA